MNKRTIIIDLIVNQKLYDGKISMDYSNTSGYFLKDAEEIILVTSPGSYTGRRRAIAMAKACQLTNSKVEIKEFHWSILLGNYFILKDKIGYLFYQNGISQGINNFQNLELKAPRENFCCNFDNSENFKIINTSMTEIWKVKNKSTTLKDIYYDKFA